MQEIWKDIKGYEGYYQVSNLGNVRSLDREIYNKHGVIYRYKGRILSKSITDRGYYQVIFSKDGKAKKAKVHRLVAETFIPNLENKKCIDHIDTNRLNNNINNLRWVTITENNNNVITKIKMSNSKKGNKNINYRKTGVNNHRSKKVLNVSTGEVFSSITEGAKKYNAIPSEIIKVCKGKQRTCKGMVWSYLKQ